MDVAQLERIVNVVVKLAIGIINVSSLIDVLAIFSPAFHHDLESPSYAKIEQIMSAASTGIVEKLVVGF